MIDLYISVLLGAFAVGVALGLISPKLLALLTAPEMNAAATIVVWIPLGMVVDGLIYGACGQTLGKKVLGVEVVGVNAEPLSGSQYIKRNFGVWVQGLGLGIPLISIITMLYQANRLNDSSPTSYDEGTWKVVAAPLTWGRVLVAICLFVGLVLITAFLNNLTD